MTPPDEDGPKHSLKVPGANLYYEVSGAGPVLLLIPGGAADAQVFAPIVERLAERFRVVRYDPRGISRSRLDGPPTDVPVETHADDAHRLLETVGSEPASVLGSSGGGVIGLALAERNPEQVRTLVAHEPPVVALLPEGAAGHTIAQEVLGAYRNEGVGGAMAKFLAIAGLGQSGPRREPTAEMREAMARMQQNVDFFLAHYMLPITAYAPDIAALRRGSSRIVVGVGEESGGQLAHETALALANRLGTPAVTFPGGHGGYMSDPGPFVEKLEEVLRVG